MISFVKNKSAAIILSNLSEFYYNMRDYKRSQIILNVANIYFENFDKEDILFYKNYSFIAINNFHITKSVIIILIYTNHQSNNRWMIVKACLKN